MVVQLQIIKEELEEYFVFIQPLFQTIHTYSTPLSNNSEQYKMYKITASMVIMYIFHNTT